MVLGRVVKARRTGEAVDMNEARDIVLAALLSEPAVLVEVVQGRGSVPREAGAWMLVLARRTVNTIGGGHLEWQAMRRARALLCESGSASPQLETLALGPQLGQCCGGVVDLRYTRVGAEDRAWLKEALTEVGVPVGLFGAGHVAQALVRSLAPLPFALHWFDSRADDAQPLPSGCEHSDPLASAVRDLGPGSRVLIMSYSHVEDFEVLQACLERQHRQGDLPFIGLIGSRSKWAGFCRRLRARGWTPETLAGVTCPIGLPGLMGKAPSVIAASVTAQLLLVGAAHPLAASEDDHETLSSQA